MIEELINNVRTLEENEKKLYKRVDCLEKQLERIGNEMKKRDNSRNHNSNSGNTASESSNFGYVENYSEVTDSVGNVEQSSKQTSYADNANFTVTDKVEIPVEENANVNVIGQNFLDQCGNTKENIDNNTQTKENEWKKVENKRKSKGRKLIEPSARPAPSRGTKVANHTLKIAERYTWLFVSGFDPETTCDDILQYIKNNGYEQTIVCDKMKTK